MIMENKICTKLEPYMPWTHKDLPQDKIEAIYSYPPSVTVYHKVIWEWIGAIALQEEGDYTEILGGEFLSSLDPYSGAFSTVVEWFKDGATPYEIATECTYGYHVNNYPTEYMSPYQGLFEFGLGIAYKNQTPLETFWGRYLLGVLLDHIWYGEDIYDAMYEHKKEWERIHKRSAYCPEFESDFDKDFYDKCKIIVNLDVSKTVPEEFVQDSVAALNKILEHPSCSFSVDGNTFHIHVGGSYCWLGIKEEDFDVLSCYPNRYAEE